MAAKFIQLKSNKVGDTLVEVLVSIAIASFAIGTSYSIANKSLENAINARERNEALNIIQNQVADLKGRYKFTYYNNKAKWDANFLADSNGTVLAPYPNAKLHFCLLDSATNPLDDATWLPQINPGIANEAQAEALTVPPYNDNGGNTCVRHLTTDYYVDIAAQVTSSTSGLPNRTAYKVAVRWAPVGGGSNQKAEVYYRF